MISSLSVTIVVNNFVSRSGMKGEHGLSLLLELEEPHVKNTILLDTGQTPEILLHNLRALNFQPSDISKVVISHGHYDHTGGLLGFMESSDHAVEILASASAWGDRFNNNQDMKQIGSGFTTTEIMERGGKLREISQPYRICDHLIVSGPIDKTESCEENKTFLRSTDEGLILDTFQDDMALIVDLGRQGLFILTGCCHSGIINTIRHSIKITGNDKIKGLIGGLHLINADIQRLMLTRDFLKTFDCDFIAPIHCSGFESTCYLRRELGDAVKFPGAGETFRIV